MVYPFSQKHYFQLDQIFITTSTYKQQQVDFFMIDNQIYFFFINMIDNQILSTKKVVTVLEVKVQK